MSLPRHGRSHTDGDSSVETLRRSHAVSPLLSTQHGGVVLPVAIVVSVDPLSSVNGPGPAGATDDTNVQFLTDRA